MTRLPARSHVTTPRVVRAIVSPAAILAAGGGAALGLVLGLGSVGAAALGAATFSVPVAIRLYWRDVWRRRPERIDPFAVQEPWRWHVQNALTNRARVRERFDTTPQGPLRDRLGEISARVEKVANESWQIAKRGQTLAEARRAIDTARIDRHIAELERSLANTSDANSATHALEARRAQRAAADRMDRIIGDTHGQLKLLDARMGEVVVRAVELSAQADSFASDASAAGLSVHTSLVSDVDDLVIEMEALRQALEETRGIARGYGPAGQGPAGGERGGGSAEGPPASDQE